MNSQPPSTKGPEPASAAVDLSVQPAATQNLREARIQDYLQKVLADPDALAANLGIINADLMPVAQQLSQAIQKALATSSQPLADLQKLMPAIEVQMRIVRQIDRLAQLSHRLHSKERFTPLPGLSSGQDN